MKLILSRADHVTGGGRGAKNSHNVKIAIQPGLYSNTKIASRTYKTTKMTIKFIEYPSMPINIGFRTNGIDLAKMLHATLILPTSMPALCL